MIIGIKMIRPNVHFKDRVKELAALKKRITSDNFEFIIVYGRRRVGKTELIKQACVGESVFYYFAHDSNNLGFFYEEVAQKFPEMQKFTISWKNIFEFLQSRVKIIIFDEVQNIFKENKDVGNIFAELIDEYIRQNRPLKIIMSGSSVSLLSSSILQDPSPLYGRKTWSLKLSPIRIMDLKLFYPTRTFKEICEIYGFADGIPYYLIQIDQPFWTWIDSGLQIPGWFPVDELDFLLKFEFKEINIYKLVLYAIATSHNTPNEIKNFLKQHGVGEGVTKGISSYLQNLLEVEFILRETPITDPPDARSGKYYLKDNFLKFWFRFMFPNLSMIQFGNLRAELFQKDYSDYMGHIFEHIVKEFLLLYPIIPFNHIGRWWGRHRKRVKGEWISSVEEIDLIAYSMDGTDALFVECKWQENVNPHSVAKIVAQKVDAVSFPGIHHQRSPKLAIFARSFISSYKQENFTLDGIPVYCFDLLRMEKEIGIRSPNRNYDENMK